MISNEELFVLVKKNPVAVACAAVALASGLGFYFRSGGVAEAEALLEQKTAEGRRLALNVKNTAQLNEQVDTMTASSGEFQRRMVQADELAQNLQYFYKIEADTGTKLIELRQTSTVASVAKAAKATPAMAFVPVAFTLRLEGEYLAALDFLRRMENGAHYARVTSATVGVARIDRTGPVTLQLNVELLGRP